MHHHAYRAHQLQIEPRAQVAVGVLQHLEHVELEAARAPPARAPVEVDVLEQDEVGRAPLVVAAVGTAVRGGRGRRRQHEQPREEAEQPRATPARLGKRRRQALALGRDETASCQRARFFWSGAMRMSETRPKSIPTIAVMSAIV